MADTDYAIVIGVGSYPGFGATEQDAQDLLGPDSDAAAVYAWMNDPTGGGITDPGRIRVVRTSVVPANGGATPWPPKEAILQEFDRLESLSQQNSTAGRGSKVGRRLYIYASGHGFARRRKEGAVFAANATRVRRHHVFTSGWLEWFANAGYFDEAVLWMDTCMWSDSTTPLETVGYRSIVAPLGGARIFSAFAARFPLQAVERTIDGAVRGVFTYTLLQGLRGAAADVATREVTSTTLRNYLTNHMRDHLDERDLNDGAVSKEPDFGFDDEIIFCKVPAISSASVTLQGFPAAAEGQPFSILTGAPPAQVAQGTVQQGKAVLELSPALYFLQMSNPVFATGFQVPGGTNVTINLTA
jgi:hypothetical protein